MEEKKIKIKSKCLHNIIYIYIEWVADTPYPENGLSLMYCCDLEGCCNDVDGVKIDCASSSSVRSSSMELFVAVVTTDGGAWSQRASGRGGGL